jgi:hypothetical protein
MAKTTYYVPVFSNDDVHWVRVTKIEADRLLKTGQFQTDTSYDHVVYLEKKDRGL